jgi:hypothetical protein
MRNIRGSGNRAPFLLSHSLAGASCNDVVLVFKEAL